jgi:hypothetical protein
MDAARRSGYIEEVSFVASLLLMTAKYGFGGRTGRLGKADRMRRVERGADVIVGRATTKPPTLLKSEEWGTRTGNTRYD